MEVVLTALTAALMAAPAFGAQPVLPLPMETAARGFIEPPPAQYRHKPKVPVRIRIFPAHQVNEKCGAAFERVLFGRTFNHHNACAVPLARSCILYMPPDDGSQWWRDLLEHETAHCNGWRH
ncbi:hypothetical protein ABLE91_05190 [Aquabacter sp. CN5-332]|uniref:hypothetical protein n=1 Tax=Aquabacter sp. CN5-332 TaxID=3156608 RepID=UPI0032B37D0C